jgi:hypothetical protein
MKRAIYLIGFLATFTLSTGFIFKLMHWPGASVMMLTGFILLDIGFLPMYFYDKYKAAKS